MGNTKFCVDCGKPFNTGTKGSSDVRDASCNKRQIEGFHTDVLKYKRIKQTLLKPDFFTDEDLAIDYYHQQLDILLKMANRSLETLLSEHTTANFPSDEAELATLIVGYIEQVQGF